MNKPIYREYQNHQGDNEDPNNTKMIQITDDSSLNRINDSLKDSMNEYNKYGAQNIFSPSNSIHYKKELKDDSSQDPKNIQLVIQNISESDKLIEINTTDHGDKEEISKIQKGMLGSQTIQYQKKRIQFRNPHYEQKEKQRKEYNWNSEVMQKWKISINIVLFVLSLKRTIKQKKQEGIKTTYSEHIEKYKIKKSNFRFRDFGLTILKFMFGILLALLTSLLLFPFILISDLFMRIYTYNNLYVSYALSHNNWFYKFILLIQIYMYVIATTFAIVINLYQSIITTVELMYNIVGTLQNNISNLSRLLYQTIQNPFSKQK